MCLLLKRVGISMVTILYSLFSSRINFVPKRNESILEAWEMFFSPEIKGEMISAADKYLRENINTTVANFFKEVDENL